MSYRDVTPAEGHDALARDPQLRALDVRTEPEHRTHRIDGAQLIPVQELAQRIHELDADGRYLVICEHGIRSVAACEMLAHAGFTDLHNLQGGMAHWLSNGLPVVRG